MHGFANSGTFYRVKENKKLIHYQCTYLVILLFAVSRHLISDAHEWINEIPTVPIYYLASQGNGLLDLFSFTPR